MLMLKNLVFFNAELEILHRQFLVFLSLMNLFFALAEMGTRVILEINIV